MSENLNRDKVLYLLDELGSDDDTEVLQAAKELKNNLATAGVTWDDLLLPYEENENLESSPVSSTEDGSQSPKSGDLDFESETIALIDDLLSDSNRSEEMREELKEYKTDIKEGDFTQEDHQYIRALHQRLNK
ncbi:MAG: hypothetical protein MK031_09795 [Alphaproteobacteria bacterium]|nr:hypothetical protein [Alphaproteobacteria bacterium]|tara:strand:+ start:2031 stop:2429 length:399 start_codon:yes stop_codon:yes gene_type:complete